MSFFTELPKLKFSERIGIKPIKTEIQMEKMDDKLKNSLWNIFSIYYLDELHTSLERDQDWNFFYIAVWHNFFNEPIDEMPIYPSFVKEWFRKRFFSWKWNELYDFIEYIPCVKSPANPEEFRKACNRELERHLSAYRFVADEITRIVEPQEIVEIEAAFSNSHRYKFGGVHAHLKSALEKFSDKKNPDYRNSIKESICAVESICQIITGDTNATLGKALGALEPKIVLPPALKQGFSKLYGYTSAEDGIRHALMSESTCQSEDARYMLISCSAFINYLIEKADKAGLLPSD